jgi:mannosyl-3-phosphoglycerate phosphatase
VQDDRTDRPQTAQAAITLARFLPFSKCKGSVGATPMRPPISLPGNSLQPYITKPSAAEPSGWPPAAGASRPGSGASHHAHQPVGTGTLLIVSDVDGTLLDAQGRLPADPATLRTHIADRLGPLAARTRIAFASSRTLPELALLQRALGIPGPCIAEDGALLAVDAADGLSIDTGVPSAVRAGRRTVHAVPIGATADTLRDALAPALAGTAIDVATTDAPHRARLGFSHTRSRRALFARQGSVLLDLDGATDTQRERLHHAVRDAGITVKRGGRWHTAVRGASKGDALDRLRAAVAAREAAPPFVIAIGNEENDVSLLQRADLPVVIGNPGRGPHPALAAIAGARCLTTSGHLGWLELFDRIPTWLAERAP